MRSIIRLATAAALGLPIVCFAAEPNDYVHTPLVEYGEREIDFKMGTQRLKDEPVRESAASLGFGYGVTQWWFTEAYLKFESGTGVSSHYDAFEWENLFQLTEHNQYPVDIGLLTEIEIPRERRVEGYELEIGPLFQGDAGPIRWNANLLFQRVLRGRSDTPRVTELVYQLQAKYPLAENFDVGAQAFGEMGQWNHFAPSNEQVHRVGPAIFGKVKLGGREAIRYNAAWLFSASPAAPKSGFRLQSEYEF
jgi:hypothetical protein